MVERREPVSTRVVERIEPSVAQPEQSPEIPFQPLIVPAIDVLATHPKTDDFTHWIRERIRPYAPNQKLCSIQLKKPLEKSSSSREPKPPPFRAADLLPSTTKALDRLANPPLLPAPPRFEDVFAPFEPMFHTVFYRRYPYHQLDDAKQNALIHLWKLWKKDRKLLEQSAAYVVQAAVWGASPHRKIQKDKLRDAYELPMLQCERYIDIRVADQSREPGWVLRSDMQIDIQSAIHSLREELSSSQCGEALVGILEDIVSRCSIKEGQKRSALSTRVYRKQRVAITEQLKTRLIAYAPNGSNE
jgi:hypothetical protein